MAEGIKWKATKRSGKIQIVEQQHIRKMGNAQAEYVFGN